MPISEQTRADARTIVSRYPEGHSRSALLPLLHLVQSEQGYVSPEGVSFCAEELGLSLAEVGAVLTFYTMFKRKPTGEYLLSVCTNLSCSLLGSDEIFARLSRHLNVEIDETTEDGRFTLERAECLAACDYAPVVTVNYEFFDKATPDSAIDLVRALERGERPEPVRGATVCTFREMSRQLAGFVEPEFERAVAQGAAHPEPGEPVDSRGTEPIGRVRAGYGVPGGEPERVLTDAKAAETYGLPPRLDAGGTETSGPDTVGTAGTGAPATGTGTADPGTSEAAVPKERRRRRSRGESRTGGTGGKE